MPGKKRSVFSKKNNSVTFSITSGGIEFADEESQLKAIEKFQIGVDEDEAEAEKADLLDTESRRLLLEKYGVLVLEDDVYNYLHHMKKRRTADAEENNENSDSANPVPAVAVGFRVDVMKAPEKIVDDQQLQALEEIDNALDADVNCESGDEAESFFGELLKGAKKEYASQYAEWSQEDGSAEEMYDDEDENPSVLKMAYKASNKHTVDAEEEDGNEFNPDAFNALQLDDSFDEEYGSGEEMSDSEDENPMVLQMAHKATKDQKVAMKDIVAKPDDAKAIVDRFQYESNSSDEEMVEVVKKVDPLRDFDCESFIHSRGSTRTFTPKIIEIMPKKPKRKPKTDMSELPEDEAAPETSGKSNVPVVRERNETAEQKKERKNLVKMHRRERREEKAERKKEFGKETQRQKDEKMRTAQPNKSARID